MLGVLVTGRLDGEAATGEMEIIGRINCDRGEDITDRTVPIAVCIHDAHSQSHQVADCRFRVSQNVHAHL